MSIHLESGFSIVRLARVDYNEWSVEIQYRYSQIIAEINKERGIEDMEIEIFSQHDNPEYVAQELKFPLADFLEALNTAIELLKDS